MYTDLICASDVLPGVESEDQGLKRSGQPPMLASPASLWIYPRTRLERLSNIGLYPSSRLLSARRCAGYPDAGSPLAPAVAAAKSIADACTGGERRGRSGSDRPSREPNNRVHQSKAMQSVNGSGSVGQNAQGRETSTSQGASGRRWRARRPMAVVVAILPLLCAPITRRSGQPISLRMTAYGLSSIISMRNCGR